uniref:BLOC-1-related complex subunit 7 n=1 Tax=Trichuris muris TaxID=70415 RepID=A0A5S6Q3C4_TRIMR
MSRRSRSDGKVALAAKINQSIESLNAAFKQTVKGSHSSEILGAAIRTFVQQESVIQNSQRNLNQLACSATKLLAVAQETAESTRYLDLAAAQLRQLNEVNFWCAKSDGKEKPEGEEER